jgi:hypothetical protein
LLEGKSKGAISIPPPQYGGIIHLFIGKRRSPSKSTFMTLTYTHNPNTKHQGLVVFSSLVNIVFDLRNHLKPKLHPSALYTCLL